MIPRFPRLAGTSSAKSAAPSALRLDALISRYTDRAAAALLDPVPGVPREHLTPAGLRVARRRIAQTLQAEFAAEAGPLLESARGEHGAARRDVRRAVDAHLASASPIAMQRATATATWLASLPAGAPEIEAFHRAVQAGDEIALLAACVAPAGSPIGGAEPIARRVLAGQTAATNGGMRAGEIVLAEAVRVVEAESLASAGEQFAVAAVGAFDAALRTIADTGAAPDQADTSTSAADLMLRGDSVAPAIAAAERVGLISPDARAAARRAAEDAVALAAIRRESDAAYGGETEGGVS